MTDRRADQTTQLQYAVPRSALSRPLPPPLPPSLEQSSSSLDPMFWPVHPAMERLWQFAVVTGQVTRFTWPDNDVEIPLPDGTTTTEYISAYYDSCEGHRGKDVFPFGLLELDNNPFDIKTGIRGNPVLGNDLTNREVLEALDPRFDSLPYVYDNFKWDHCLSEGYDFDDAWGEPTPSARKPFLARDGPHLAVYTSFGRKMAELMKEEGDRLKEEKEGGAPSGST